ncbi:TetR/AcrR family transcriptional regulator [Spirillospora sp. NPDC050679]
MSPRMTADQRREQVIGAALAEFAGGGYEGTSTGAIARRVGVSQPYLFRLFPSKHALFLATAERCFDELEKAMREAAGGLYGEEAIVAMGRRYREILTGDPSMLRFQLQIYAVALVDDDVKRIGGERWARLWRTISELSGADAAEVMRFISVGMLLNVLTAFGVPYVPGADLPASLDAWAKEGRD